MKAIRLNKGSGGLERLTVVEMDEPGAPQEGEILVRLHASSLNYHEDLIEAFRYEASGAHFGKICVEI